MAMLVVLKISNYYGFRWHVHFQTNYFLDVLNFVTSITVNMASEFMAFHYTRLCTSW